VLHILWKTASRSEYNASRKASPERQSHFVETICCLWITTCKNVLLFVVVFSINSSNYKLYVVAIIHACKVRDWNPFSTVLLFANIVRVWIWLEMIWNCEHLQLSRACGYEGPNTHTRHCQSQHTGPDNQSQHILYVGMRDFIKNKAFNQTGERGAVIM